MRISELVPIVGVNPNIGPVVILGGSVAAPFNIGAFTFLISELTTSSSTRKPISAVVQSCLIVAAVNASGPSGEFVGFALLDNCSRLLCYPVASSLLNSIKIAIHRSLIPIVRYPACLSFPPLNIVPTSSSLII